MSFIPYPFALAVALLCTVATASADTAVPPAGPAPALTGSGAADMIRRLVREDTDSGVVTNQAITVAGQDFYQYFIHAWREKEGSERFTLAVRERPSARWGSEVWIEYRQGQVFRSRLPGSRSALRQLGDAAAQSSYQAVLEADARRQVSRDADIAADEF